MEFEDGEIFSEDDFTLTSFDVFEDMRRNEQLVDFRITLENRSVIGHRLVLAARIPHFREIFSNSQEEEVILSEIDAEVLESVTNFAYSGKIQITLGNAVPLITASRFLQLPRVYNACWEFVGKKINSNNVLKFRRLAEDHGCPKFLEAADRYIRQNFEEFSSSEGFTDLSFQQLKEIISRDDINVSKEEKVFEAVITWVRSSECERRDLLPELLSSVRMYFLTPGYLTRRVSTEELVSSSLLCRDLVDEAKSYYLLPHERSRFCSLQSQRRYCELEPVSPPLPTQTPQNMCHESLDGDPRKSSLYSIWRCEDGIINVKHFDGEKWLHSSSYDSDEDIQEVVLMDEMIYIFVTSYVYTFNIRTDKWCYFQCQQSVCGSGSVRCNDVMYFFGGVDEDSGKVRSFDPRQKTFLDECRMRNPITCPGVALLRTGSSFTLETHIYVTGGHYERNVSRAVERYNLQNKLWSKVPSMHYKRCDHGCHSLNRKIYVCGGFEIDVLQPLNSAEVFDPLTNEWSVIASTNLVKCLLSAVADGDKLYICGKQNYLSLHFGDLEIYDLKNGEWKTGACIRVPKTRHKVFLVKPAVTHQV